jgi:hypothetical protein
LEVKLRTIRPAWLVLGTFAWGLAAAPSRSLAEPEELSAESLAATAFKLMAQGHYDEGCETYERSERIDPTPQGMLRVAECNERRGRTASAWVAFGQALDMADEREDEDTARTAHEGVERIEANLGKIEIDVPDEVVRVAGLEVQRDGVSVPAAVFGVPVPVDPGLHVVRATAQGRYPWSVQFGLARGPASITVMIPVLEPTSSSGFIDPPNGDLLVDPFALGAAAPLPTLAELPVASGLPEIEPSRPSSMAAAQRTIGSILGGAGLVSVVAGAVFGLQAMATRDEFESTCVARVCAAEAIDAHRRFISQARASTALLGLGMTALAAGVVVYVTAPPEAAVGSSSVALGLGPAFTRESLGLVAAGAF